MKQGRQLPLAVPVSRVRRKLFHPEEALLHGRTHISPDDFKNLPPTKPFVKSAKSNTADPSGTRHRAPVTEASVRHRRGGRGSPPGTSGAAPRAELGPVHGHRSAGSAECGTHGPPARHGVPAASARPLSTQETKVDGTLSEESEKLTSDGWSGKVCAVGSPKGWEDPSATRGATCLPDGKRSGRPS